MIRPLTGVELSSSKTRSGMTNLAELMPRLIRSYELQAELKQRRNQLAADTRPSPAPIPTGKVEIVQSTFAWF